MINKVILVGNLGKDPDIHTTGTGKKIASFSLATSESYKNREGERVTETEWHTVKAWSPLAEIIEQYLQKGSQVYVEGKIKTRSYEDKDKVKRYTTEIICDTLKMIGGKPQQSAKPEPKADPMCDPLANITPPATEQRAEDYATGPDDLPY